MRIVVFFVRSSAGELDLARRAVAEEVVIDELPAIVGVQAAKREGHRGPHLLQGLTTVWLLPSTARLSTQPV